MGQNTCISLETVITALFTLTSLLLTPSFAEASWLVDPARFHASVHGRVSCIDCHDDKTDQTPHPNPSDVTGKRDGFFNSERCSSCHDDARTMVESGAHGGKRVNNLEDIADCLRCHDPHYEPFREDTGGSYDPSRPIRSQCGVCHEKRTTLPDPLPEIVDCAGCHIFARLDDGESKARISLLCFHCHGRDGESGKSKTSAGLIEIDEYRSSGHAMLSCLDCHHEAARFEHRKQGITGCRQCHPAHDEKVAHDAHALVACEACHLQGIVPVRESVTGRIMWRKGPGPDSPVRVHNLTPTGDENSCRRCHLAGNQIGAAAMVLPAKSILCMPCHAATLSVGDTVTVVSLILFLMGFAGVSSVWFSGSLPGENDGGLLNRIFRLLLAVIRTIFSFRIFSICKVLFLDALLQRRIFRQSRSRWIIHGLIFYPFIFRCCWGLAALFSSLLLPDWPFVWKMLDKNDPPGAFLFDLSGAMVLIGVILQIGRRIRSRSDELPGFPEPDRPAFGLIGGVIITGFILEGLRIAMTGSPAGSGYAFLGYAVSLLFPGALDLTGIYGYVWYVHAILLGAFVVYLPFSRMLHIFMGPISLALNAATRHRR